MPKPGSKGVLSAPMRMYFGSHPGVRYGKEFPAIPKPPLSGYQIFSVEKRQELAAGEADPEAAPVDRFRASLTAIVEAWHGLSDEEKAVYVKRSEAERAKYLRDIEEIGRKHPGAPVAKRSVRVERDGKIVKITKYGVMQPRRPSQVMIECAKVWAEAHPEEAQKKQTVSERSEAVQKFYEGLPKAKMEELKARCAANTEEHRAAMVAFKESRDRYAATLPDMDNRHYQALLRKCGLAKRTLKRDAVDHAEKKKKKEVVRKAAAKNPKAAKGGARKPAAKAVAKKAAAKPAAKKAVKKVVAAKPAAKKPAPKKTPVVKAKKAAAPVKATKKADLAPAKKPSFLVRK